MAKKTPSPVMAYAVAELKRNPKLEFGKLLASAKGKGLKMIPIIYGRAKLALGLVKAKPRKAVKAGAVKLAGRGPGRPSNGRANGGINVSGLDGSLSQIVKMVRQAEAQQKALAQIQVILNTITQASGKRGPGRPRKYA